MPATRSGSSKAFRSRSRRQRKSGLTHLKTGQPSAHLNYPATLNSFRSCLKVIDTFRRFQIQPHVFDPLEAVLALLDNLVENLLASIQIRMPDFVGMPRVKLVVLWHLSSNCFSRYRVVGKRKDASVPIQGPSTRFSRIYASRSRSISPARQQQPQRRASDAVFAAAESLPGLGVTEILALGEPQAGVA